MNHRILFTASTYSHIYNFHRPYLQEFSRLGWVVDVACGGTPIHLPEATRIIHIPFEKRLAAPANLRATQLLRQAIQENHYDIISCHTSLASFFVRIAVMGLHNRPLVVCTSHGYLFDNTSPSSQRLLLSTAEKITAPVTDLLMTMNQWDTDYAFQHKLGRIIVKIPGMGVNFQQLSPLEGEGTALRCSLGLSPVQIVLIYAAEFSHRKSHDCLLKAMTELPDHIVLLLPGRGDRLEKCMDLVNQFGLQNRVIFPGQVSNMSEWYAAADAAVSSSRSEGLPFNIMEAMYYSLPVIASDVKGHTDLIRNEENGLLFPYGNWRICAEQIRRVIDHPSLARDMGQRAFTSVQQYNLTSVLPSVMAQYQSLIKFGVAV